MENARPLTTEESSAPNSAKFKASNKNRQRLTPRQSRLLTALLETDGWISRESVDRITGASNGPQIVSELREKVTGYEGIEMQRAEAVDRDGNTCKPGRYKLTWMGRQRAMQWLVAANQGGAAAHG